MIFRHLHPRFILLEKVVTIALLLPGTLPLHAQPIEDNPSACDCDQITISSEEEQGGCPDSVKRETCAKFREMEQWQETLKKQKELRRLEDSMVPRYRKTH